MGNLVEIARFYDPEEAYCARSFLLSNGIDSFVQNDHYLTAAPWMRIALQGYGLQVMASAENDARMLLDTIGAAELETAEDSPSDATPLIRKPNWLWLPVAFSTSIPFLPKPKPGWFGLLQSTILLTLYIAVLYLAYSWLAWISFWL
ncbi:MAG: hypothetical protein CMI63_01395 [Parvularcula sp.]|nr:hypothetical protein [Parvularcula sp.]